MRGTLLVLTLLATAASAADWIVYNAKVLTVDSRFTVAEAVAVAANRIRAVGSNAAILAAHRAPATRLLNAGGRTVAPGLIDSHVHALSAGLSEARGKLPRLDSFAAIRAFVRARARSIPPGEWILVPRTFPTRLKELRMPTREVLDAVTTHPVGFDASYVWVFNSVALRQNQITRATADPEGGEIGRDGSGEPNGILRNANRLIRNLPRNTDGAASEAEQLAALRAQLERYLKAGLTAIGDRAVTHEEVALYRRLGKPPVRAVLTWRMDASGAFPALRERIGDAPQLGPGIDPAWLKMDAFKVTLDGGMTIGTAYQREPYGAFGRQLYGQTRPDSRGQLFLSPSKLFSIMEEARKLGWALTAHSQGGGAIDTLLDCFERLDAQAPLAPTRSHLMHASFQHPDAIARLARLGLPADVQTAWLALDGPALSKVFPHGGMRWFIPLATYRKHGVILAGGSDHMTGHEKNTATNPYNPFHGMAAAVTRRMRDGRVLYPEERLSREDALRMYTIWAAYVQHADRERGSLEAGKLADLVILDRDYLTVPEEQIARIEPLLVMLDGEVRWSRLPAYPEK